MPKFLCLHILLTAAVAAFSSPLPDTLSAYATDNPENAVAVMTPEDRIKTYERLARESDGADAERYIDMMMQAAKESGSHEKESCPAVGKEGHFSGRGRGNVRIRSLFIILQGIYEKIRHDAAGIQEIPEIAAIFANCNMLFPKGSAYEPRTVVTLVLSPGQTLSSGFSSAHMEHIHIHVGDKVYMPEYTSSEEYVQSVSLEIEIPQEDFEVVACYSVQQQLTEGGYTMRLEDNENVRLFGVSEEMQYKYFDCYLLTEDAWSITDVQFKVGGGEWNIVSDVNGCSFSRDDENDNLYRIKIRPDYQNVTGDVTLRVTGEQHGRYSITWENATGEFIDLEKSVLPDMSIDGETVTAEIWVNDGQYLNTAASSVEGLDLEVTARSYVEFVMPAEDVTITLDIREKIPVTYTESENVSPQSQQKIPREMT